VKSFIFAIIVFAAGLLVHNSVDAASRPNVIIVLTDDQGYGDLSCHGNPVLKTPNLDRLHSESIRFTDFHVAPMCTPTRGQLMTGVDALRNGAMNVSSGRTLLRREFPTMPEIFAANKYRTAIFGKWHLGDNYPYRPQDRGFEESIWFPSSHTPSAPDYWNNDYFDDVYWHNGERKSFKGYCTDVFFNEAMRWMRERAQRKEPFFCYLPTNTPHWPPFVPEKYREPYRDQSRDIASFFGMIANIDENMGRLEAFLRETELRDNTIVIFMTDNGTANGESVFNAGMRGKKIGLHDGGHRVPFFVRWPAGKLRPSGNVDVMVQAQDVPPTLIDLCGLKKTKSAKFDGISLGDLLRGKTENLPDRMLVTQFSRMMRSEPQKADAAVLWNKWRFVSDTELYDISQDPAQERNVFEQFPDVVAQMRQHYAKWWEGVEPRVNEFSPIHVGSRHENPVMLTPCDWRDVFLDQQAQIRRVKANGTWTLFVEKTGDYSVALRRWPREADLPITAGAPEYNATNGKYKPGEAFLITAARLAVGAFDATKPVSATDKEIVFQVPLKRGRTDLQTWFKDAQGEGIAGAYYVYVGSKGR
jgi:arylsulfatase A-like enzyme